MNAARNGATEIGTRELLTSDAANVSIFGLVAAAAFDLVWLLVTTQLTSLATWICSAVAAAALIVAFLVPVVVFRRPGLSFDDDTVWWTTGISTHHRVPRASVQFGVRRRYGIEQATISNDGGPPVLVPRLVVITWSKPDPTLAVREVDSETGKPGPWFDTGQTWDGLTPTLLTDTLANERALTKAIERGIE